MKCVTTNSDQILKHKGKIKKEQSKHGLLHELEVGSGTIEE